MPVIMKENVQYAYTDPGIKAHTLSYTEYQALSTEEKMNGDLYFIPDKQPEGNPSLIWDKLGTATLDTDADNVSDAVNELNSSLMKCQQVQFGLPQTKTINANSSGILLDHFDISTSTITDTIFTNKTLTQLFGGHTVLGVVGLWCSSGLIPLETIVWANTNELTVRYYNQATSSITVTAIRLLVFYI